MKEGSVLKRSKTKVRGTQFSFCFAVFIVCFGKSYGSFVALDRGVARFWGGYCQLGKMMSLTEHSTPDMTSFSCHFLLNFLVRVSRLHGRCPS